MEPQLAGHVTPLKLYLLVKASLPIGFALVAVAHASLAAYLRCQATPEGTAWLAGPFLKTICPVSVAEFEAAKQVPDGVVITESTLGGQEVALAFRPRQEWPKAFKYFRLSR
jgi:hypothetical protein